MQTDMVHRLTFMREDAVPHTTTASGYFAESMLDQQFDKLSKDERTLFATVFDGGGTRRQYVRQAA